MSTIWRNRWIGIGIALLIFAVDQWIKSYMVNTLRLQDVYHVDLLPFFDFTWTENRGVSLGMFEAGSPEARWMLVGFTALVAAAVFVWILREKNRWDIAALSMILGGAIGNIRDRYLLGYVIDYADFHIGDFRPFLIFNLADAAITVGVVIILARALFMREKPAKDDSDQTAPDAAETVDA
jgi:signal peptidase II